MLDALNQARVLPAPKLWRRLSSLPMLSYYNRLFALVLACNVGAIGLEPDLSTMVLINLSLATLVRQQYLINGLFWLATRVPVTWPLWIRCRAAKVYHFGGLHSGGAVAATGWLIAMVGDQVAMHLRAPGSVPPTALWWSVVLLAGLLMMIIMALPWVRGRFHNGFERVHRFAGWGVLLVFWGQTLSALANPLHSGTFWMLVVLTVSIALPWLRLRKVAIDTARPSSHAVIARFSHTTPFTGSSTAISLSPLLEWHSFANIPSPGQPGFRLIISRAGDWTGQFIEQLPAHVWVKGITTAGVANVETLFTSVLYIATGSGIGPVMPHLLAGKVPARLIWSTRSPRKTYGDALVDEILQAQPQALIWDSDELGKPDLVQLAYGAVQAFGVEAVICIANQGVTRRVVQELGARGIPAYGAIWDS
ncbi:hypothetical protein DYL61_29910 [Pseudomonas nabeulensis]|uniref:Uncharacterized protein n=1 Tax=Pseudomonas nabeulensis TaxID=2293833 RepID=A0A4Z0AFP7_9PSED|nr:hypothetical protein [Pseudomonas nabeulensis]TFY85207.1 hypothetical protein DYL61_29910 [Pseudomonas nabeulensis]